MFTGHLLHLFMGAAIMLLSMGQALQAQDTGCNDPLPLTAGTTIDTRPGIYLRNQPSLSGAAVEYLDISLTLRIEEGPVCADGINWWRTHGPVNVNPGWVAEREAFDGRYLIFATAPDPATLCPQPLSFSAGSAFPLLADVRIRQEPNLNALVLHVAAAETPATIIDGPQCQDAMNWWLVQVPYQELILQGWMAEGRFGQTYITDPDTPDPDAICGPAMRLPIGSRAAVNVTDFKPKSLRSYPGTEAPLLFSLIDGIAFDVLAGPVCADNLNWWQVQLVARPDVTGWISEGGPGNRAIRRFTQDRLVGN